MQNNKDNNYLPDRINYKEVEYVAKNNDDKRLVTKLEAVSEKKSDPIFLYATAFTADLLIFAVGIGFSWTSPVIPKLESPDSPLGFAINASQKSWIATFLCIGAAVGPLIAGRMADSIGRKKTLVFLAFPILIAMFILAFARNLYLFYLARFLHGISVGSTLAVLPMYLGEITENHNRGKYGCIMCVFITSGVLYPFVVGPMFNIQTFCLTCTFPLFIFLIIFCLFMPETPQYLLSKNNKQEAVDALMALRDQGYNEVQRELEQLTRMAEEENEKAGIKELLSVPGLRKGFLVSSGLVIIQQMSGVNAVTGYLHTIFAATGSSFPPDLSAIFIGIVQVLVNFVTAAVVEKLGRRFLVLASTIGSAASIILLGTYFFLNRNHFNIEFLWWLPIASLIVYIIAFNLGIGPLPWTITAEMFPANVKSTASSLTASICFLASSGVTLGFPLLAEMLGMAECFWLFGILLSVGIVFIYIMVPETKGRSVSEIQDILSGKSSNI